jgi:hypothetical protein
MRCVASGFSRKDVAALNFLPIRAPSDLGPCVDGLVEQVEGAITVPQHQLQRGFFVEGT